MHQKIFMSDTKQRILDKALELFNDKGIEYVGMRELAGELDMRIGNVTYYFPTKDALVYELALQLSETNASLFDKANAASLLLFLETRRKIFVNQGKYRCLQLSFVHLTERNDLIKTHHEKVRKSRTNALKDAVGVLHQNGYIKATNEESEILTLLLAMVGRLWLSEAALNHRHLTINQQINFYLKVFANLFLPYATRKGGTDISTFVATL
jgi:AcrR family transcriptional regulator